MKNEAYLGVRALVVVPTRELAYQIYNESLKLTQGRNWRTIMFTKATANTLAVKEVRDKVGKGIPCLHMQHSYFIVQMSSSAHRYGL